MDSKQEEFKTKNIKASFYRTFPGNLYKNIPWLAYIPEIKGIYSRYYQKIEFNENLSSINYYKKTDTAIPLVGDIPEKSKHEWVRYLNEVSKCKLCKEKTEKLPVYSFNPQISDNLMVLFLSDYPRSEGIFSEEKEDLFQKIVKAMNLKEDDYRVSLSIKCLPAGDRCIESMASTCFNNVLKEVIFLKPKVIVSFGALSLEHLLGRRERISMVHGKFLEKEFTLGSRKHICPIFPIFHLDYLFINPMIKKTVWNDILKLMKYIKKS